MKRKNFLFLTCNQTFFVVMTTAVLSVLSVLSLDNQFMFCYLCQSFNPYSQSVTLFPLFSHILLPIPIISYILLPIPSLQSYFVTHSHCSYFVTPSHCSVIFCYSIPSLSDILLPYPIIQSYSVTPSHNSVILCNSFL